MNFFLRYFLLTLFVFACNHISAQTFRIDSLKNELKKSPKDSVVVILYNAIADALYAYDTANALQYQEKGYLLAKKMNWDYAF
ncbi:MAG: hypothetical protein IPO53_15365 [Chitinophagaceae bacterium]|nr:hypothetical protein [Chitinophagaceae bacterium]